MANDSVECSAGGIADARQGSIPGGILDLKIYGGITLSLVNRDPLEQFLRCFKVFFMIRWSNFDNFYDPLSSLKCLTEQFKVSH